jgi:hypothetical protein
MLFIEDPSRAVAFNNLEEGILAQSELESYLGGQTRRWSLKLRGDLPIGLEVAAAIAAAAAREATLRIKPVETSVPRY